MSNSHHSREGTASAFGDDFPVLGTAVGGKRSSDNTLQPFLVDDTGNLKVNIISGGGGTVTNDGTFAKETGGNLDAIKTNLDTLAGIVSASRAAVNPIVGQIGVQGGSGVVTGITQRVVLATDVALPAGTNVIGHIVVDSGTVSTKTDLTPSAPTFATVGAASGQILASNVNRKGLVLINTAPNRISIAFGAAAVLDSGITLNPFGGTFVMDEFIFDTGAVNAISTGAGNNIAIQEYLS